MHSHARTRQSKIALTRVRLYVRIHVAEYGKMKCLMCKIKLKSKWHACKWILFVLYASQLLSWWRQFNIKNAIINLRMGNDAVSTWSEGMNVCGRGIFVRVCVCAWYIFCVMHMAAVVVVVIPEETLTELWIREYWIFSAFFANDSTSATLNHRWFMN